MSNSRKILFMLSSVSVINLLHGLDELNSATLFRDQKESLSDGQLSIEGLSSSEAPVNLTNFEVFHKTKRAAPNRRVSELIASDNNNNNNNNNSSSNNNNNNYNNNNNTKCDEYLRIKTSLENIGRSKRSAFVNGGRSALSDEFPHMGAVGWKAINGSWIFICGSSVISLKFMLTAGHCSKVSSRYPNVANRTPEIVRLGDKSIADVNSKGYNAYDVNIQRIIKHPQYAPPKKYFDIAIIELQEYLIIDKTVQPACLWTNHDISSFGNKATVTGWGVIDTVTSQTTTELQAGDVDILSTGVCNDSLRPMCTHLWCGMSESQLCAGKLSGGIDACQGDSGGPLQVLINSPSGHEGSIHYIIGVTSFGNGCAKANTPAVYTRISSFIDWIEDVVWGNKS